VNITDYQRYDATGLAALIARGEVGRAEVVLAAIESIETKNGALNAVVATCFEQALEQAQTTTLSATTAEQCVRPLLGVPYLVKDLNSFVAGLPATNGSRAFAGFVPNNDAEVIRRLRAAGLVILGKTNTPEFGLAICTNSTQFGATHNPFNHDFSAGGSSGGSASAVASGMVPAAYATDSGGSIRIPASNCGLFGLKPTRSRVPLGNDMGEGLAGFSTAHAVTHSVRDSALLLQLTSGALAGDPYSAPHQYIPVPESATETLRPLRIGLSTSGFANETIAGECVAAAEEAAKRCVALGCTVEPARPDIDGLALRHAFDVLFSANMRVLVERICAMHNTEDVTELVEPTTQAAAEHAACYSAADYANAIATTQHAARALGQFFATYDILLTPVLAEPPVRLGKFHLQSPDWPTYLRELLDAIPFTPLFNATGAPAMSVPVTTSADGVPIGAHFGAAHGNEGQLLRLAAALEQSHPWHKRI
jgi:amidase